ncbi:hypothetical protein WN944_008790 [Citrus x changshan-huyou]|uniref:Uncharacterized protein n=1 Tax=Citrus x changshan-huyou TaxID=2935761 RepID=A0AAP0QW89_9ROSI
MATKAGTLLTQKMENKLTTQPGNAHHYTSPPHLEIFRDIFYLAPRFKIRVWGRFSDHGDPMKFVGAPKTEQQKRKHHDQESKEEKRERKVFMCYSGFHCSIFSKAWFDLVVLLASLVLDLQVDVEEEMMRKL